MCKRNYSTVSGSKQNESSCDGESDSRDNSRKSKILSTIWTASKVAAGIGLVYLAYSSLVEQGFADESEFGGQSYTTNSSCLSSKTRELKSTKLVNLHSGISSAKCHNDNNNITTICYDETNPLTRCITGNTGKTVCRREEDTITEYSAKAPSYAEYFLPLSENECIDKASRYVQLYSNGETDIECDSHDAGCVCEIKDKLKHFCMIDGSTKYTSCVYGNWLAEYSPGNRLTTEVDPNEPLGSGKRQDMAAKRLIYRARKYGYRDPDIECENNDSLFTSTCRLKNDSLSCTTGGYDGMITCRRNSADPHPRGSIYTTLVDLIADNVLKTSSRQ